MKFTIRLFVLISLLLSSQSFFAQETISNSDKSILEAKKASEHIKKIKLEQNKIDKHKRDLKQAEKSIKKTQKKIEKQKAANQTQADKFAAKTSTEIDIQKQKIRTTKQDLQIHVLELKLIEQQQELEKLRSSF